MEFHISRQARDRYRFGESLFTLSGNVIFADFRAARVFVQKINEKRDLVRFPEQALKTGQLISMGLIDEILHYVVQLYRKEIDAHAIERALDFLNKTLGREKVLRALQAFTEEFPPVGVYRQEISPEGYLEGKTEGTPNVHVALEEMLLLWLADMNPAFAPFAELFDDSNLKRDTAYLAVIGALRTFFDKEPPFGPFSQSLVEMLRSPAVAVPHSLPGQLEYIREHWGLLLGRYLYRLLSSLDLIKEEEKITFLGPGPAEVYRFKGLELEAERFSPDREWMPRLVLMAKNIYVWLDQLSKKHGRHIARLNEIPDEELDLLQRQGFSGLWLIGVWERSPASQKIKQLCGNPEAVPSAYSLFDYRIAADLGGEEAYRDFKDRSWKRGIRLASDMVPNHVGIYSRWAVEHPDWFVSLDQNPYPWYTYGGPDLSPDGRVGIHIEDHYYNRTDAAVVFKRLDRLSGNEQYVYHGNDGTSMPWNDTAQLNYLNPEMREAMIRTILHVAGKFPVIRFDAAMTLTKKHFQRLWFPEPGTGGAVPTRAEHGLRKQDFDRLMPKEFWREVVDRVAEEAPDTLLLAEAFWLLEGYFVRTLGMHRVYNSAFMNMLRDEENAKYRAVMKNTLEFDPEVLRRFVNFMNNPDERTAVDQFGKENKYFGVCVLMATMPGLPMFGHGQIEGFAEKYGMEYRKAYWDEQPDTHLIQRHEREIFPLLHRRHLFAGVDNFLLFDFFTGEGYVNEDVFAYSNGHGDNRGLVAYHNKNGMAAGWIRSSVAYSVKTGGDGARALTQKTLGEGLGINPGNDRFTTFRDHLGNLEFIRESKELCEKGLYVELGPYQYHVFLDFRQIYDNEQRHYARLTAYLNGRGVPSVEDALREIFLQPIHHAFGALFDRSLLQRLLDTRTALAENSIETIPQDLLREVEQKTLHLLREIKKYTRGKGDEQWIVGGITHMVSTVAAFDALKERLVSRSPDISVKVMSVLESDSVNKDLAFFTLYGWALIHGLGKAVSEEGDVQETSRSWIDEWAFGRLINNAFGDLGFDEYSISRTMVIIKIFTSHQSWYRKKVIADTRDILVSFLRDSEVQRFLDVNRHLDILWFNKEGFETLLAWMLLTACIRIESDPSVTGEERDGEIDMARNIVAALYEAFEKSDYQIEKLVESLQNRSGTPAVTD